MYISVFIHSYHHQNYPILDIFRFLCYVMLMLDFFSVVFFYSECKLNSMPDCFYEFCMCESRYRQPLVRHTPHLLNAQLSLIYISFQEEQTTSIWANHSTAAPLPVLAVSIRPKSISDSCVKIPNWFKNFMLIFYNFEFRNRNASCDGMIFSFKNWNSYILSYS